MKTIFYFALTFFFMATSALANSTDFNSDGVTNVSGDGAILVQNLGLTGVTLADGDANGDGVVDVSGDGSTLVAHLGTDLVAPGAGHALYDPVTGQVLVSTNGAGFIEISSSLGQLIPANAVPTGAVPNAFTSDPFTTSAINYLGFNPLGTGGILNDFSLGAILPIGLNGGGLNSYLPNFLFRWAPIGGGQVFERLIGLPEPSSFVLAALAGVGMVWMRRRGWISPSRTNGV